MTRVKSFTSELKIFKTIGEIRELDDQVNQFLAKNAVKKVVSVSDTCTTDDSGASIGLIRVVTYEE